MSATINRPDDGHTEAMEELAAGFALEALDDTEVRRFRPHLSACERCRALVADYAAVAEMLPDALDEVEASTGLRDRVIERARADPPQRPATVEPRPTPEGGPTPLRAGPRPARRAPLWALPVAALLAVTLGLGYWNYRLQEQLAAQAGVVQAQQQALLAVASGARQWSVAGTDQAPRAGGVLVQDPSDPRPILLVHGLPELSPRQSYQAWVIAGGAPVEAGLLGPGTGGLQVARLDWPLGQADTVAVTIEPQGGSRAPTGPIVVAGQL
jgi:anti-sigma-K factor RskA